MSLATSYVVRRAVFSQLLGIVL